MEEGVLFGSVRSPPVGARQARLQDETSRLGWVGGVQRLGDVPNFLYVGTRRTALRPRDRPARIPWSMGEHKGVYIMLVCVGGRVLTCG